MRVVRRALSELPAGIACTPYTDDFSVNRKNNKMRKLPPALHTYYSVIGHNNNDMQ